MVKTCESAMGDQIKVAEDLKCNLCKKFKCKASGELFKHLSKAHKNARSVCRFCSRNFFDETSLKKHLNLHLTNLSSVFKCALCPLSFFNKSKLRRHQVTHESCSNYKDGFISTAEELDEETTQRKKHKITRKQSTKTIDNFVDVSKLPEKYDCEFDFTSSVDADKEKNGDMDTVQNKTTSDEISNLEAVSENFSDAPNSNSKSEGTLSMLSCVHCKTLFVNQVFLTRHLELHKKRDLIYKYQCKYCTKRFLVPQKLFAHFKKTHKGETPFTCDICKQNFTAQPEFSKHIKTNHEDGIIKFVNGFILYAEKVVKPQDASDIQKSQDESCLDDAIDVKKVGNPQDNTEVMSKMGSSLNTDSEGEDSEFLSIVKARKNSTAFKHCDICDVKLRANSVKKHMENHKRGARFKCHLCGQNVREESKFHLHMKMHFKNDAFLCRCGVKLKSQDMLDDHRLKVHAVVKQSDGFSATQTVHNTSSKVSQLLVKKIYKSTPIVSAKASKLIKSKGGNDAKAIANAAVSFNVKAVNPLKAECKNNIILKKITFEEAKEKNKLMIKPFHLSEAKKPVLTFVGPKIFPVNKDTNAFSNFECTPNISTNLSRNVSKHPKTKKYLIVPINKSTVNDLGNVRLVNSNPLASVLKDEVKISPPAKQRKGKVFDYLTIIQKSLSETMNVEVDCKETIKIEK